MNPTLVRIIRERMQSQTTEQLLDIWTINDRATWSPEAFEAVRTLLADRGHGKLPPQNDPPPVAQRRTLHNDPVAAYWMEWLRPVLWVAIVLSALHIARTAIPFALAPADVLRFLRTAPAQFAFHLAAEVLLPLWVIPAAAMCLRPRPIAWRALLLYTWVALVIGVLEALAGVHARLDGRRLDVSFVSQFLSLLHAAAVSLVLPLVLNVLLRRPEIRSIYVVQGGPGFDPAARQPLPPTDPILP